MKKILYILLLLSGVACAPDLDTYPKNALSPATFWDTKKDADLALTGFYSGFESPSTILYRDCASDDSFNPFEWEGWRNVGRGTFSAANAGAGYFDYGTINRCNIFIQNIDNVKELDAEGKAAYKSQARFIRAYRYFLMHYSYGGIPLVTVPFDSPEEAKIPRNSADEVANFIKTELEDIIPHMPESYPANQYGRATKAAAQALLMRHLLFKGDNAGALKVAKEIKERTLFPSYAGLFDPENEQNEEILFSLQLTVDLYKMDYTPFMPNVSGGWSSVVPTQDFVDAYEMADGRTIEEAKATGDYDETNPFVNRDPRLRATVIYPGQIWQGKPHVPPTSNPDNFSKTGYNYRKYLNRYAADNNGNYRNSGADIIIMRYAEVLLTIAETSNEISGPSAEVYNALNKIRSRAGMPDVNQAKYNTKETLRELIRNERRVELAQEGLRRWDIDRYKISPVVLNKTIYRKPFTLLTTTQPNGDYNVNMSTTDKVELDVRTFDPNKNYLWPIPQWAIDKNTKLTQNPGY